MDRKYRDYYIVTFERNRYYGQNLLDWRFREMFSISHQKEMYGNHAVKIRWYSFSRQPYALLSIKKRYTNSVLVTVQTIRGVDKIIEYTPEKEKAFNEHRAGTARLIKRRQIFDSYLQHLSVWIQKDDKIAWQKLIKENNEQREFTQGTESQKR